MKNCAAFIRCFVVFMFHSRISGGHPFQVHRSHHDDRGRMPLDDPYFQPSSNWSTSNNQRVQVTTLDINRGYNHSPIHPAPYTTARTQRSQARTNNNNIRSKRHNCVLDFCEEVDDYPEAIVKRVVSRTNILDAYFREAEVAFDLNNRGAFDEEDDSNDTMCRVKSVTLYPKTAKNTKKEDRILVNVDGYRQGIVFETCLENSSCRFSESFPTGYVSSCKQKYVKRSLAVLDSDKQNTAWDTFEVPSCCVCIIKKE